MDVHCLSNRLPELIAKYYDFALPVASDSRDTKFFTMWCKSDH